MPKAAAKTTKSIESKEQDTLVMPPHALSVPRFVPSNETAGKSPFPVDSHGAWDPLRQYIKEAVITPLLTRDEELSLAAKVQEGDEAARERMILSNLRLVIKIAKEKDRQIDRFFVSS